MAEGRFPIIKLFLQNVAVFTFFDVITHTAQRIHLSGYSHTADLYSIVFVNPADDICLPHRARCLLQCKHILIATICSK